MNHHEHRPTSAAAARVVCPEIRAIGLLDLGGAAGEGDGECRADAASPWSRPPLPSRCRLVGADMARLGQVQNTRQTRTPVGSGRGCRRIGAAHTVGAVRMTVLRGHCRSACLDRLLVPLETPQPEPDRATVRTPQDRRRACAFGWTPRDCRADSLPVAGPIAPSLAMS